MGNERKIRVLIAKPGLDGHDRGAKVLSLGLREEGMEVSYTGLGQSPEQIVERAVRENADVIGLSSLAGAHRSLFPRVAELARQKGRNNILIIGGGTIPEEDIPFLLENGMNAIFPSGATIGEIAEYIRQNTRL